MINKPGIYTIGSDEYHADPCPEPSLSNSLAKVMIGQSPRHAWLQHPRLNAKYRPSESSRFDLGTAAHDLILEGGTAKICVINPEDYRSKPTKAEPEGSIPKGWTNSAIRAARDEARSNGLVPVLPWDNMALQDMVKEAQDFIARTELSDIFSQGKAEQTIVWREDGAWCRARADYLTDDRKIILDYKTTTNAEPDFFCRRVLCQMGYDFQDQFYSRCVMLAADVEMPKFVFLAQEIEAPYCCSLVAADPMMRELAAIEVERAISMWKSCIGNSVWPAYSTRIHWASPPAWKISQAHDDEAEDIDNLFEDEK